MHQQLGVHCNALPYNSRAVHRNRNGLGGNSGNGAVDVVSVLPKIKRPGRANPEPLTKGANNDQTRSLDAYRHYNTSKRKEQEKMDEMEREDLMRDAYFDATHKEYEVKVTLEITYRTTAKTRDEAESDAYDDIKDALRGSHLDYEFTDFETEEMDD